MVYLDTQLTIQHIILYAKNWYLKSEDIWADLRKCLSADGYSGEFFSNREIVELFIRQLERIHRRYFNKVSNFVFETTEDVCWKYGYYTQNNVKFVHRNIKSDKVYDIDESVVRYCLMCFRDYIEKGDWFPCRPDSEKCLPLPIHITENELLTYFGEKQ